MQQERLTVVQQKSALAQGSGLVVSARYVGSGDCKVVIGYPGLPNVSKTMETGDAVLFETPHDGVLEARVLEIDYPKSAVELLISQVSPRGGLLAGAVDTDPNNAPFSAEELRKIAASIASAKKKVETIDELLPEQLQLVHRKLDEIEMSARRFGRKDWINYVMGTLTSVGVSAALSSEAYTRIIKALNASFDWLFATGILRIG